MRKYKFAILGLGYVGLSFALEFGKKYEVLKCVINTEMVKELKDGINRTQEAY